MEQYMLAYVATKALTALPVQVTVGYCVGSCCMFVVMVKNIPQVCVDRGALILRAFTIVQCKHDMEQDFAARNYRPGLVDELISTLDRSLESLRVTELAVTIRCLSLYGAECPYRAILSYG